VPAFSAAAAAAAATGGPTPVSLIPSAGRYFSHTSAYRGVSTPAAGAAAGTAGHLFFPMPSATAATAAGRTTTAAGAAAAEQALSASLQVATVAIQQPPSSSSSSRLLPGFGRAQGLTCMTQRQGFIGTAVLILREEGPTAFTRGIQVGMGYFLVGFGTGVWDRCMGQVYRTGV
jgi:hypothetical protein